MRTRTVGLLAFSPCTHSMKMAYFFLYTWTTPPLWTFVLSSYNLNFIIPSTAHRSTIILLSQLFGKGRKHHLPPNVRRWTETPFSVFASVRNHKGVEPDFDSCLSRDCCRQEEVCMPVSFPTNTSPPSASVFTCSSETLQFMSYWKESKRGMLPIEDMMLGGWGRENKGDLYPGNCLPDTVACPAVTDDNF